MTVASETRSPLTFRSILPLAWVITAVGVANALAMPFFALFLAENSVPARSRWGRSC